MSKIYVPVTLDQYINESKSITLKRGYKDKKPVVVGASAPIRNQVLSYVAESKRVSSSDLKRFVAGLNETNANPNAAATMWLRRNSKFFVSESRQGKTFYKLSPIGQRLASRFAPMTESEILEKKKYDFKDPKTKEPGIVDKKNKDEEVEECDSSVKEGLSSDRRKRIEQIIENIKSRRGNTINEAEDEEEDKKEEGEEGEEGAGSADELSFDDLDLEGENKEGEGKEHEAGESDEEEAEEHEEGGEEEGEEDEESEGGEGEDKVEITEFILTVDDVDAALEELAELDIDASKVVDPDGEPQEGEEEAYKEDEISVQADHWEALKGWLEEKGVDVEEMFGGEIEVEDAEEGEADAEGDDMDLDLGGGEEDDMDLDLGGGEGDDELELDLGDEDKPEVEESLTGMEKHEDEMNNLIKGAKQVVINYK